MTDMILDELTEVSLMLQVMTIYAIKSYNLGNAVSHTDIQKARNALTRVYGEDPIHLVALKVD